MSSARCRFRANVGSIQVGGQTLPTFIQENIPWTGDGLHCFIKAWPSMNRTFSFTGLIADPERFLRSISRAWATRRWKMKMPRVSAIRRWPILRLKCPSPDIALKPIQPVTGFEIDGDRVYLSQTTGIGIVDFPAIKEKFLFAPFSRVDCSDCGNGGWQELHSMFWNESMKRRLFRDRLFEK